MNSRLRYDVLSSDAQLVALVYGAVFPHAVAANRVPRLLAHADLLAKGRRLTAAAVKDALIELYGAGLLVAPEPTEQKPPAAARAWAPWLCIEAQRRKCLDALVAAFDVEFPAPLRSYNPASDEMLVRWVAITGRFNQLGATYHIPPGCWRFLAEPAAWHLLSSLPERYQTSAIAACLEHLMDRLLPADPVLNAWREQGVELGPHAGAMALLRLFQDRPEDALACFRGPAPAGDADAERRWHAHEAATEALLATLRGDDAGARDAILASIDALKSGTRKRKVYPDSDAFTLALLALVRRDDAGDRALAQDLIRLADERDLSAQVLPLLQDALRLRTEGAVGVLRPLNGAEQPRLAAFWNGLRACWWDSYSMYRDPELGEALLEFTRRAERNGYAWLAREAAAVTDRVAAAVALPEAAERQPPPPTAATRSLVDLVAPPAPWEVPLQALEQLAFETRSAKQPAPALDASQDRRLAWEIVPGGNGATLPRIAPREQVRGRGGDWTRGKPVSPQRLAREADELDHLIAQDRAALATLDANDEFGAPALAALADHPLLVTAEGTPVTVSCEEPTLMLADATDGGLRAWLEPPPTADAAWQVTATGPAHWRVVHFEPGHLRLAEVIPAAGLELPADARPRLLQIVTSLAADLRVRSLLGDDVVRPVTADPEPWVRLEPWQRGLSVSVVVQPIPGADLWLLPGAGQDRAFARVGDALLQAGRDLAAERLACDALLSAVPLLPAGCAQGEALAIAEPEACLELLVALRAAEARLLWPAGERFRLRGSADSAGLSVQVRAAQDWFAASGELQVDEHRVLDLERLLALLDETPGSRFLELADGEFIALSEALHRRLTDVRALADVDRRSGQVRLAPVAVAALESLEGVGDFQADVRWRELQDRWRDAGSYDPPLPDGLRAELRPYQQDGFRWLARLSHWGAGACLADDMGLGKTLQTLTLLLHRRASGPGLVIAPTSVVANWASESARFTPDLRVRVYAGPAPGRFPLLDGLGAGDLVLTTYGLLQSDIGRFADIDWGSVVLDEAQAIKNPDTKRARAVRRLRAGFRMVTTGTPIQNHLLDLHSLFAFINPGLLGSSTGFKARYALPVERDRDANAREQLKRLIAPFVLRRLKGEVLADLPARTDVTLHVELSAQEAALYEALRRRALEDMSAPTAESGGKRHLQVLAHLTRLRLACCNPALVQDVAAPPSSKLATFSDTLTELLDGGHKVLVFSQFVRHLKLIEARVQELGVAYQYLDGQTPPADRQRRIDAFQSGKGDVFLISLKAGGTGLNLTAADYVLHMDPWWNPAVEDQASDRAHRIGQTRPVTVYRLVTRGTIEEQIVQLHGRKRDLAERLLTGSDQPGRLDAEELLALLRAGEAVLDDQEKVAGTTTPSG